jgi:hypothetical protein
LRVERAENEERRAKSGERGKLKRGCMKWFWTALALVAVAGLAAEPLTLTWDASTDAAVTGYRLYYGTNSGAYPFVTNSGLSVTQEVVLPHAGRWFFAATAVTREGLESAFSQEVVWESLPARPVVTSEPWVLLFPLLDCSTNLASWRSVTGAPTWWPATNRVELFRATGLLIERVQRVVTR